MNFRKGKFIMGINSLSKQFFRGLLGMQDSPEVKKYRHIPSISTEIE